MSLSIIVVMPLRSDNVKLHCNDAAAAPQRGQQTLLSRSSGAVAHA